MFYTPRTLRNQIFVNDVYIGSIESDDCAARLVRRLRTMGYRAFAESNVQRF